MAPRIVFLSRLPPLPIFTKIFGIDYLSDCGFDIFFLDLSTLIDNIYSPHSSKKEEPFNSCKTIKISHINDLEAFVKESFDSTIFIDFAAGLAEYNLKIGQVFRVLKKYNARYYIISNGSNPCDHHHINNRLPGLLFKVKKAVRRPRLLFDFLIRKIIVQLIKLNILYQKPYRIFGNVNSPILISYIKKYAMSSSTIVPINSRDHDAYLEYMRVAPKGVKTSRICVFLDEDHTNHPDFYLFGIPPLNQSEYISSMNNFFDYLEKKTGLSVVIAAHPKSSFTSDNHPYGNRVFTRDDTLQLVAKSEMVIAHSSTSINFPVLFCKPIMLVITGEMKNRPDMINAIYAFARELELIPIDLECPDEVSSIEFDYKKPVNYDNYLYKYVKNIKPINNVLCEIIAEVATQDLNRLKSE